MSKYRRYAKTVGKWATAIVGAIGIAFLLQASPSPIYSVYVGAMIVFFALLVGGDDDRT